MKTREDFYFERGDDTEINETVDCRCSKEWISS